MKDFDVLSSGRGICDQFLLVFDLLDEEREEWVEVIFLIVSKAFKGLYRDCY
jgi:hypothetical protein